MTDMEAYISRVMRETHNLALKHAAHVANMYGRGDIAKDILFLQMEITNEHNSSPQPEVNETP